jgi:hypothetical protein
MSWGIDKKCWEAVTMENKKTVKYQMIRSTAYVEDSGLITTYGISCRADAYASLSSPVDCTMVNDISTRPELIEGFVDMLNVQGADPLHLKDLIYDFLL